MRRGEINQKNRIIITKDENSKKIEISCEGLWTGKDRHRISRMLLREMRSAAYKEKQFRKQADPKEQIQKVAIEGAENFDLTEQKRLTGLKAYWAAKKKKKLEEEKNDVRGQQESK